MKRITISIFCAVAFFLGAILASCASSGSPTSSVPVSHSESDIQNSASCWLKSFNISYGDWVGDHQCTALARLLTTAPGYGNDANGNALGGYDYVLQQQSKGIHIPLLSEVKNTLKPCDNLVLVGSGYEAVGHTVVVYYPDLANDKVYYLDQNFNNEGVTLRQISLNKSENNAYVIAANCAKQKRCQLGSDNGPIIAAPQPSVPAINVTIEAATVPSTVTSPISSLWPDSLIGKWEGTVTNNTNFQGKSQTHLFLEIQRTPNGQMIVIQDQFPDIEQDKYTNSETTDGNFYYCFNDYQVLGGDKINTGIRCFNLINDNQLKYFGGEADVSQSGILTRVK